MDILDTDEYLRVISHEDFKLLGYTLIELIELKEFALINNWKPKENIMSSGNHMVDAQDLDDSDELRIEIGDVFKDKNGIYWEVDDIEGETVRVIPSEDQTEYFTKQELVDQMDSQQ